MVHFGEFLKTWSLRSKSVTRQVSYNRTKIGEKCQNSNATLLVIFKHWANVLNCGPNLVGNPVVWSLGDYDLLQWSYRENNSGALEEQKQPLTQTTTAPSTLPPAQVTNPTPCTVAEILPPTALQSQQANPGAPPVGSNLAYNTNQCTMVAASCAGCVQFQQQCQQQSHEAMEMTAILHSQPPLQLVSCHGPIMHPSTPSNQR